MNPILTLEWPRQGIEIDLGRVSRFRWQWRLTNHGTGVSREVGLGTVQALRRLHGDPLVFRHEGPPAEEGAGETPRPEELGERIDRLKDELGYGVVSGAARRWWDSFEDENRHRRRLVLSVLQELAKHLPLYHEVHGRDGSLFSEFYLAYVCGNTDNVRANLCYLEYRLLKKRDERVASGGACPRRPVRRDEPGGSPPTEDEVP